MSFKELLGLENNLIPQIATGFGAGIGRRSTLCGNFTGSVMVIGMISGRKNPENQISKERVYKACYEFGKRFDQEFGSTVCYDLIKCHLDDPQERQKWLDAGGMEKCTAIVERTAEMLCEFIDKME